MYLSIYILEGEKTRDWSIFLELGLEQQRMFISNILLLSGESAIYEARASQVFLCLSTPFFEASWFRYIYSAKHLMTYKLNAVQTSLSLDSFWHQCMGLKAEMLNFQRVWTETCVVCQTFSAGKLTMTRRTLLQNFTLRQREVTRTGKVNYFQKRQSCLKIICVGSSRSIGITPIFSYFSSIFQYGSM